MEHLGLDIDTYANDPGHWGASLANTAEVMVPCLDAVQARSVVEVGAYAGDLTGLLVQWARRGSARVVAIDPSPHDELVELDRNSPELELIRETSLEALPRVSDSDVVIIDGDHNYWTVSEELRIVAEAAPGPDMPLVLLHDVSWPHARRDDYFDPEQIPADFLQEIAEGGRVFPGVAGLRTGGLPYRYPAAREGGARNGVLTAVEDFVESRDDLRLAVVPAFFGLGVIWHREAPWASEVERIVEFWDRNPMLERLEANRVLHLAGTHYQMDILARANERIARQEAVLKRLLESSAFAVAERLSRLRVRAGIGTEHEQISRNDVRRALNGDG
jgi:SAM-dependent methyltransferase